MIKKCHKIRLKTVHQLVDRSQRLSAASAAQAGAIVNTSWLHHVHLPPHAPVPSHSKAPAAFLLPPLAWSCSPMLLLPLTPRLLPLVPSHSYLHLVPSLLLSPLFLLSLVPSHATGSPSHAPAFSSIPIPAPPKLMSPP